MITDTGGVDDESFNQSAWEGLQRAGIHHDMDVKFIESNSDEDYTGNINQMIAEGHDLIWGIGFMMGDAILEAARQNPDQLFAIIDYAYAPEDGDNLIGVVFKAQEPSFMVGYMAGLTTVSNRIGFIGGMHSDIIDQFEFGFRAGVAFAAHELQKDITVDVEYVGDWVDQDKAYEIASRMYSSGVDIIFAAAGAAGGGMFTAAIEFDKLCIGVDRDQYNLAPDNTLTSAMKLVGNAIADVSKAVMDGHHADYGGTTRVFGLAEGGVGIPDHTPASLEVYSKTKTIEEQITNGTINVPYNEASYNTFVNSSN
jgi:basic membrane protein A